MKKIKILIFFVICFLAISLAFLTFQNYQLKNEIQELNKGIETKSMNAVNDFVGFVISKVDKCEPVTLMANDKSATVNKMGCEQ
jgi:cell division protein FtsL